MLAVVAVLTIFCQILWMAADVHSFGSNCPLDKSQELMRILSMNSANIVSSSKSHSSHKHFCTSFHNNHPSNCSLPFQKLSKIKDPDVGMESKSHLKIAFIGDQGIGNNSKKVLSMISDWSPDLIMQLGDFDYQDNPLAFMQMYDTLLGSQIPVLAAIGNHDFLKWYIPGEGYRDLFVNRLSHHYPKDLECIGEFGVNMACIFKQEIIIIVSGIGTLGTSHASFVDSILSQYSQVPFKICAWHKNQKAYQTGDKYDETGYEIYDICRKHGAIVATAHEHSYERTLVMSSFANKSIAENYNEPTTMDTKSQNLVIEPGKTFAFVSGLGGESIRLWRNNSQLNSWWGATAALDVSNRNIIDVYTYSLINYCLEWCQLWSAFMLIS